MMLIFGSWFAGCATPNPEQVLIPSSTLITTPQTVETKPNTAIPDITPTKTFSPTPTVITIAEPFGCLRPPEDYSRLQVNGHWLSQRTLFMLRHAYELYGGAIDITEQAITQGHYSDVEVLSFGTHSGGGVIDISVIDHTTWKVLYEEIEPLILALRQAGFAAWLRDYDELSPGSPIHIHAVAVGDNELSNAASEQLNGQNGYFRGFNGLPQESGTPIPTSGGELIICSWMLEQGYKDLRLQ